MAVRVFFDLPHLYYLPQYQPVIHALEARGASSKLVCYRGAHTAMEATVANEKCSVEWVDDTRAALQLYQQQSPDWVIFGNAFRYAQEIPRATRRGLVYHASGTGFKTASLHPGMTDVDVRFVSGPERVPVFREQFPDVDLVEVGFAKLDPLFAEQPDGLAFDLSKAGLNPELPTLLFAPTFYPSCIEYMSAAWPEDFARYNLLIKPHDFTLTKSRYKKQRRLLHAWAEYPNVYLATELEYSLLPFMARADLLITDRSSALFEFVALDKPGVICDFVKLRWTYRGPLRFRLRQRMASSREPFADDICVRVPHYRALFETVERALANPGEKSAARRLYRDRVMGACDGKAGERIAEYLLNHSNRVAQSH